MYQPYSSQVRILAGDEDEHWYTVDGCVAQELVEAGLAEAVADERQVYIRVIRVIADMAQVRERVFTRWRRRKNKPSLRAPDSSSGGGDQGLKPLVGAFQSVYLIVLPVEL